MLYEVITDRIALGQLQDLQSPGSGLPEVEASAIGAERQALGLEGDRDLGLALPLGVEDLDDPVGPEDEEAFAVRRADRT